MGAGHDAVAEELAARLRAGGHEARVVDVLALLPSGVGPALRAGYRGAVRHAPKLYEWVYAAFLAPGPRGPESRDGRAASSVAGREGVPRPGSAPLAALAERPLMDAVDAWHPDAVISTFHLSAQVTGRLRQRRALGVPSVVAVVDFAVHRGWLHPGNDLHLCVAEQAARTAAAATGRAAEATGPVVPAAFHTATDSAPGHRRGELQRLASGRPVVLLSAGAWGVGSGLSGTAKELAAAGFCPALLCGRDERLRQRAARVPETVALGWVEDMPELLASADALVDNAAGQTAAQALAAGLPVVGYRPLPGHGAEGVRAMAEAGVARLARDRGELTAELRRVTRPGPEREERVRAGMALFRADAAQRIAELAARGADDVRVPQRGSAAGEGRGRPEPA